MGLHEQSLMPHHDSRHLELKCCVLVFLIQYLNSLTNKNKIIILESDATNLVRALNSTEFDLSDVGGPDQGRP